MTLKSVGWGRIGRMRDRGGGSGRPKTFVKFRVSILCHTLWRDKYRINTGISAFLADIDIDRGKTAHVSRYPYILKSVQTMKHN